MEGSRKKITTFYNQHLQQSISKQITHQTLKQQKTKLGAPPVH